MFLTTSLAEASIIGSLEPIFILGFPFIFAMVYVIVVNTRRAKESQHREESRREIAAYVAEGSMSVEQAEKLMAAGPKPDADDKE